MMQFSAMLVFLFSVWLICVHSINGGGGKKESTTPEYKEFEPVQVSEIFHLLHVPTNTTIT